MKHLHAFLLRFIISRLDGFHRTSFRGFVRLLVACIQYDIHRDIIPLTVTDSPVMYPLLGESKNDTTSAISELVPNLFIGI